MSRALIKEILRSIKRSLSRFISIIAIVALGTCFFAGINAVSPDMRATADKYFNEKKLMDINVVSTIGLTDSDAWEISGIDGVEAVMPSKTVDALVSIDGKGLLGVDGSVFSCRAYSIDPNAFLEGGVNESYLNRLTLVEGRYPQKINECVVDGCDTAVPKDLAVGKKITLEGDGYNINSTLSVTEFKIVGIVETPIFISFERGATTVGSGKLGGFMFISEGAFCNDFYSSIFVRAKGTEEYPTYSKKYDEFITPLIERIQAVSSGCIAWRTQELRDTLPPIIESGTAELETKKQEAEEKLAQALEQVEKVKYYAKNGEAELEEKRSQADAQLSIAQAEYDEGEAMYYDGVEEYNKNFEEYIEALAQANENPKAREQYYAAVKALNSAELRLTTAKEGIEFLESSIKAIERAIKTQDGQKLYDEIVKALIESGVISSEEAMSREELSERLIELKEKLILSKDEYQKGMAEYIKNKAAVDEASVLIDQLDKLDAAGEELEKVRAQLEEAKEELDSSKEKLDVAKMKFEYEIKQAESDLAKAKENYSTIDEQYQQKVRETNNAFKDAQFDLDSAKSLMNSLYDAKWYVTGRSELQGYESYNQTAQNMQAFAKVFPLFFFLLAALICLTTMTRMVEEERIQLGTLKALGYTTQAIVAKYIIYASLATFIGCIIGLSFGFTLLPTAIYNSYGMLFNLPPLSCKFYFGYALAGLLGSLLSTVTASLYACKNELATCPAQLMRPKAPKSGKRVALEKINIIWGRLNFTSKVTVRNLFRNKKRFFMTVFGIAGCTGLLLTGFGLGGSIGAILPGQYGENGVAQYDLQIALSENLSSSGDVSQTLSFIESDTRLDASTLTYFRTLFATSRNTDELFEANLVVPENGETLSQLIKLHNRKSGKALSLNEGDVIISEKLANKTGTKVGDEILIKDEGEERPLKVTGITENYAYHYIYISRDVYESVFGGDIGYNCVLARLSDSVKTSAGLEGKKNTLATDLMDLDGVMSVIFNSQIIENFGSTINTLNAVIVTVFTGAAGALAFVVLYNLSNININERVRELATIKVLGFYDKEVSQYIYRENVILTIMGILLGLVLGIPVHSYVIRVAEVNVVMFGRSIDWQSFMLSALITLFFAFVVNLLMHFKMKKISMVESMKSVE